MTSTSDHPRNNRHHPWTMGLGLWVGLSLMAFARAALGHEFWIQPATFTPAVDSVLTIGLHVGDGFPGQPVVRDAGAFEKFVIAGPDGTAKVPGWDGRHPAGMTRVKTAGVHVIGYQTVPQRLELDAARFEAYLREDGLERIIERRAKRGESTARGREKYRRCAKSIVTVGDGSGPAAATAFDRVLDLPLELVPEQDPRDASATSVSFKLLYDGRPCPGVMVGARHRERPGHFSGARTDENGRVTLPIDAPGAWLVSGVHMVEAPGDDADADWHSFWASLSFAR